MKKYFLFDNHTITIDSPEYSDFRTCWNGDEKDFDGVEIFDFLDSAKPGDTWIDETGVIECIPNGKTGLLDALINGGIVEVLI